jgi:hypothetical protein
MIWQEDRAIFVAEARLGPVTVYKRNAEGKRYMNQSEAHLPFVELQDEGRAAARPTSSAERALPYD